MQLTRHRTPAGPRWALDGRWLPAGFRLSWLLELPAAAARQVLAALPLGAPAEGPLLAPLDPEQEVWAAGVTYLRSRDARMAEAQVKDIYWRVYEAERPELFFKGQGWRMAGPGEPVRVRRDSRWNVPEPELAVVFTRTLEPFGYTIGNDVSSRDIEGENPLYLPQAKVYDGAGALGPGIVVVEGEEALGACAIALEIWREGQLVVQGETTTERMKRAPGELVRWLGKELSFPWGGVLMTGTGIVPPDEFSLQPGDRVVIRLGSLVLENPVELRGGGNW
jgi:2-dehydro-3-deoxy-D-arabinonate dehydratase